MNRYLIRLSFFLLYGAAALSAAPTITAVQNSASNITPGLPNAGIAPGSIFVVYGTGLGPATIATASSAFQSTTLSNTSVAVTVGSTTVNALMYYTSATQVAALLPSNTPTGTATFTVTYNGQASNSSTQTVVANNLGIFTVNSSGLGPGIVTYPDYSLVSPSKAANCGGPSTTCGAANPGDTLILWGTGLGAVSGNDAAGAGLGQNMPSLPLQLWIGGVQAKVVYQGRSGCCIGEDQIAFTVPDNAPTGCAVPLLVQINNQISNNVSIAIAGSTRNCTPSDAAFASLETPQFATLLPIALGDLELNRVQNDDGTFRDAAHLNFLKLRSVPGGLQPFLLSFIDDPPLGSCRVQNDLGGNSVGDSVLTDLVPLDAGTNLVIKGPAGSFTVPAATGDRVNLSLTGAFLVPGNYTITGNGGKDVGPFTANLTVPALPTITSPVGAANNLTVTRSNGFTITWNPNGSPGHVEIAVSSSIDPNNNLGASVVCTAPITAGTFTIPPSDLLALPAGNRTFLAFQPGNFGSATSTPFSAPGLNLGIAQVFSGGLGLSGFQLK